MGELLISSILAVINTDIKIDGSFCDLYTRVGMPGAEAQKLERAYQERILVNELMYEKCP